MFNRIKSTLAILCALIICASCDTDTYNLGGSLINGLDDLQVSTGTFKLSTRSMLTEAVPAYGNVSYLGTVKDPETGEYITANYMSQFHVLEGFSLPEKNLIKSRDEAGNIIADSCELRIFYNSFYGDSLAAMKLVAHELIEPMHEDRDYYSDFDPSAAGLIRNDGINVGCTYTLTDLNVSESIRKGEDYSPSIRINLNKPYTDKQGNTYSNYGSYIINKYYEDPTNFKNSIRMTNNVIPGFYFESTGGLGSMAYIPLTQLNLYYRFGMADKDTTIVGTKSFAGTQEVLQCTRYINDNTCLATLAQEDDCTYLKTPSGILTEITFPVDEVTSGHENDTINSAKFTLQRLVNTSGSKHTFDAASTVLLLPADSLDTFFTKHSIANNKNSYLAKIDEKNGTYTFNNVSSLIQAMHNSKRQGNTSPNWNKAVLVPVTIRTNTAGSVVRIDHDMSLTSTRLVGGKNNPHSPIELYVIYSKFK